MWSRAPSYEWQSKAVRAWENAGRVGMIEAVTGSGKTHVAIHALAKLHDADRNISALIVVPTVPLMEQWHAKLTKALTRKHPNERVGRIGGEHRDDFAVPPLAYVATISSALRHVGGRFAHCWERGFPSLLVADECHHYLDAPAWGRIVKDYRWTYRLGLSATVGRYNGDALGRVVYEYQFADAHRDNLVPTFDVLNVGVELTWGERDGYLSLTNQIREQFALIHERYEDQLASVPDEWLFKRLQQIMGKLGSGNEPEIERLFLLLFRRAAVHYTAENKLRLAEEATRLLVEHGRKVLVFFERIAAADLVDERIDREAARRLRDQLGRAAPYLWCEVYHSGMNAQDRTAVLGGFRETRAGALLVCRSFDEGIDIPEVDAAVLVASTQSKRQRIQRIGRTLRWGHGSKRPLILTLYAKGTSDGAVTEEDRTHFRGVADVQHADGRTAMTKLMSLLAARRAPAGTVPEPSPSGEGMMLLATGDSLDPEALSSMLTKYVKRAQPIQILYRSGESRKGNFEACFSYGVRLSGNIVPLHGVLKVWVQQ